MLLTWCSGRPLTDELIARPWRIWRLGVEFGRMHATIHRVRAPLELARAGDWVARAGPDEQPLQERIRALPPRTDVLLHLDYHPFNVLTDGRRVTAVLDWTNAQTGDPRADVARTFTILRKEPAPRTVAGRWESLLRWLVARAWRHGYEQRAGAPEAMDLFYAWAGAVLLRDLLPGAGRPGRWWKPEDFEPVRRWIAACKRDAGLS